jgi:hypothetical protein
MVGGSKESTKSAFADTRRMREISDMVLQVVTSPQFLEQVAAVKAAPPERRLEEASKRLTPKALREIGIELPPNLRLSSRYFDDQAPTEVELADTAAGVNIVTALNEARPGLLDELKVSRPDIFRRIVAPDLVERASGGCACAGWATVCVGGGWSAVRAE